MSILNTQTFKPDRTQNVTLFIVAYRQAGPVPKNFHPIHETLHHVRSLYSNPLTIFLY